jgi:hypothetical protein
MAFFNVVKKRVTCWIELGWFQLNFKEILVMKYKPNLIK